MRRVFKDSDLKYETRTKGGEKNADNLKLLKAKALRFILRMRRNPIMKRANKVPECTAAEDESAQAVSDAQGDESVGESYGRSVGAESTDEEGGEMDQGAAASLEELNLTGSTISG